MRLTSAPLIGLRAAGLGLLALWVASCGSGADSAGSVCAERDPHLTYDNFGKGFISKHCVGCHSSLIAGNQRKGAPPGVDLDTYNGVVTWAYRIEARSLGESPGMPPGGGPSEAERARLEEWLGCQVLRDADAQQAQGGR